MAHHLRIIYMGTPEFALPGLQKLVEAGFPVVAVVTAPDKPSGRGLQIKSTPIKQYSESVGIPVLQPVKLKDPEFISTLQSFNADLQVVVAFRMLPEIVWQMPKLGTINLHASLLPDYRGAAPINHAVMQGEKVTGVTTFFLQHAIDTGDMIEQVKVDITDDDNAGTLHDKLMLTGAELILKTVSAIENQTYTTTPQSGTSNKIAPKIFRDDCRINWNQSAIQVHNFIRGLSPYPGAFTEVNGMQWKILKSEVIMTSPDVSPGTMQTDGKTYLRFACSDAYINVITLQPEGKRKMDIAEFLRGYRA